MPAGVTYMSAEAACTFTSLVTFGEAGLGRVL